MPRGGTILGSSRTNPAKIDGGFDTIAANFEKLGIDALVAIGGEDTLGVATELDARGVKVIGVPKTIDNDLSATDYTFGFDTAVNIATEAIDRLHTTAESHHRALIVEVMGRHAGWIASARGHGRRRERHLDPGDSVRHRAGVSPTSSTASRATTRRSSSSPRVRRLPRERWRSRPATSTRLVTCAWAASVSGLADEIEKRTGKEARTTVLGHIQRGGTPTAFDRVLATRFGLHAIDAVHDGNFGMMVALRGTDIVLSKLSDATGVLKTVPR